MNNKAYITGTGSFLPKNLITNEDLIDAFGKRMDWAINIIGSVERYWATDLKTGELINEYTNARMAANAAEEALNDAGLKATDIDLIILVTATPDYHLPPTVTFVQDLLEIERCATMEIRAGCSGTGQAISVARQYIESGEYQRIMVIGSELNSRWLNTKKYKDIYGKSGKSKEMPRAAKGYLLNISMFGDGAGALILEGKECGKDVDPSREGIFCCTLNSVGGGQRAGMKIKLGGSLHPTAGPHGGDLHYFPVEHNFEDIFNKTPDLVRNSFRELLLKTKLTPDDVDRVIPPQANAGFSETILKGTHLESNEKKFFFNFKKVGNTSSASIPIAIDQANRQGKLNDGDIALLLPSEASKWLFCGIALRWRKFNG